MIPTLAPSMGMTAKFLQRAAAVRDSTGALG